MTVAERAPAGLDQDLPRLNLVGVEWRRIQVVLRLRPEPGLAAADVKLALHRPGAVQGSAARRGRSAAEHVAPTRVWLEDQVVVARFNVMQGPGQMPLAPGTWRLAAMTADGNGAMRVEDPDGAAARVPSASFPTPRGIYTAALRASAGSVSLAISLMPTRTATSAVGRLRGAAWFGRSLARAAARELYLAAVAAVRRLAPRRRPAVLFTSSTRPRLGGNLGPVHDRMLERGLLRGVDVLLWFKPHPHAPTSPLERLRQAWRLGRPDLIVLDDFHPEVALIRDPNVPIIQLWHASGVVKTILYSRIGKPDGPDPWSWHYKNFRSAIVGAECDIAHFAEAFGIPEQRVAASGIPRMDRFFDPVARQAGREAALAAYPEARGRFVILFAPTFRGVGVGRSYDIGVLDYAALHALCVEKDAVFVIRLHPRLRHDLQIPDSFRDRLLDGTDAATDAPDVLFATDLLVTDYSSIIFEFATLGRPMLFFAPDLDEYTENVDFYEPFETLVPGRIVRTLPELLDAIRNEDYGEDRLAAFVGRHVAHMDGHATDRVIDQLILPGLRRP